MPNLGEICPSHVLDKGKLNSFADELSKKLGVKTQSIHEPASSLSGGNQQKVVIAKWVGKKPSIIIMDEPTRGIDIGAKRDIYDLMNELTNDGVSIIMVSSELPEVLGMSDRVMVIHEGRVAGILDRLRCNTRIDYDISHRRTIMDSKALQYVKKIRPPLSASSYYLSLSLS